MYVLVMEKNTRYARVGATYPWKYQGPYMAQAAPGHMSIYLFGIAQQPECCPHSKTILYQHAFLLSALDCMCEDKD